jgi:hypothetical protein
MALEMYLTGSKFFFNAQHMEDGFPVEDIRVSLGYWRQHPDLHGYIVKAFAKDGVDDCNEIILDGPKIGTIMAVVRDKALPHVEGFNFGSSNINDDTVLEDLNKFAQALAWLAPINNESGFVRRVIYRASW